LQELSRLALLYRSLVGFDFYLFVLDKDIGRLRAAL
jgi:hypothetical protein